MNRVLLAIGGLLVGLFAMLFAVPAMVDWNRYRGVFEEEASRLLGREVRVAGNVNLRLLPVPYVQFEKVRVADTTANVGRPLFYAEDFTVWLSVGGLLSGGLEAKDIQLHKPVVTLVLDGRGGGSWSSLIPKRGASLLVPSRVTLASVQIHSGKLEILGADGSSKAMFDKIDGELSGQDIEGPYKVAANLAISGAQREVRLSTAKAADDGSVRFKGSVRDPQTGASYGLDGIARDVLKTVGIEGELTARLPLPGVLAGNDGKVGSQSRSKADNEFDVRAKLKGDTTGFTLEDLALSFEQAGRPQLATGSAKVNWSDKTQVDVAISSQWLDLDKIAGAETGASAIALMQGVASSLSRILATDGRTQAVMAIEQATLGGDVISKLAATLEQAEGRLAIKALSAHLPGGTRLSAAGIFDGALPDYRYSGQVNLRGASLARFATWVGRDGKFQLPERDGAYALRGDVTIGTKELTGRNLTIEVAKNLLTGDASWKAGEPQRIEARLEGTEIDVTPLVPSGDPSVTQLRNLIASLAGATPAQSGNKPSKFGIGAAEADVKLRLDRLLVGSGRYRDVSAEFKIADGRLTLPLLKLNAAEGFGIELRGDLSDVARTAVKGTLTGLLEAETAAGAIALQKAIGLPETLISADGAKLVTPLRLAGRLTLGQRGPETQEFAIDGMVAKSRLAGSIRLGSPTPSWRDRAIDAAVSVEGSDAPTLVALAMGQGGSTAALPAAPGARVDIRAIGNGGAGLSSVASLHTSSGRSRWQGRISVDESGALALGGQLELASSDLGQELGLLGVRSRPGLTGPVSGSIALEKSRWPLKLSSTDLQVGGSRLAGKIIIDKASDGFRLSGSIETNRASVPLLLATLSAPPVRPSPKGVAVGWSETPFDLALLDGFADIQLQINAQRLALASGIDVDSAALTVASKPGSIEIRMRDGKAFGGSVTGVLGLEKAAAGARLAVQLGLNGGRMETLSSAAIGARPVAQGLVSASLTAQSTALSPRGAIVGLSGTGNLRFGIARFNRWSPASVAAEVAAILDTRGEQLPDAIRARLETATANGELTLDRQSIALTIGDGGIRAAPMIVNTQNGRFTGRLALDLDQLVVTGDVRIDAKQRAPQRDTPSQSELPPIVVSYAGPVAQFDRLDPRFDSETLQREVIVRKVEQDVQELERLRVEDENRARVERDRLLAERQDAERRLAERQKLEALQQNAPMPPIAGPSPPPDATPLSTDANRTQGSAAAGAIQVPTGTTSGDGASIPPATPAAAPALPAATPPPTSSRAPASSPTPSNSRPRRDPFRPLSEGSP